MNNLTIEDLFKPISKDDILNFEIQNKVYLPEYLKVFFLKYNGASVKEYMYKQKYVVNAFIPLIKNKLDTSVEDFLPWIQNKEFMIGRYDLIPFATDPGGIPFLVSIGGDDERVVYYSAVGLDENPLRKIADSFEEFINGLKAEDE